MAELRAIEPEKASACERRSDGTVDGLVPSHRIEIDGGTASAIDLVAERDGLDQRLTTAIGGFRRGEQCGEHIAGMAAAFDTVHVVEVEQAQHHAVGESSHFRRGTRSRAPYRR